MTTDSKLRELIAKLEAVRVSHSDWAGYIVHRSDPTQQVLEYDQYCPACVIKSLKADLESLLNAAPRPEAPKCIGPMDCDADLPGEPHSPKCPLHNAAEWEQHQQRESEVARQVYLDEAPRPDAQQDTRYENLKFIADNLAEQLDEIQEICLEAGIVEGSVSTKVEAVRKLAALAAPRKGQAFDAQLFYDQLVDGQIIKESDGDPWPLTKSEARQICDALAERLKVAWPLRVTAAGLAASTGEKGAQQPPFQRPMSPTEWEKSYSTPYESLSPAEKRFRDAELCAWNWMCRAEEAERKLEIIKSVAKEHMFDGDYSRFEYALSQRKS